jgi:hypothetical protein
MRAPLVRLLFITATLVRIGGTEAMAQPDLEYEVKAAFLVNFTRFVDWPEEAFPDPEAPFIIGVVGPTNPFNDRLENAVHDQNVNGRPLLVRYGPTLADIGAVQMLFITGADPEPTSAILAELNQRPVLTVGEIPQFTALGGMVRFFLREGRMAFEINRKPADEAGLRISARLLTLADIHGEKPRR